jgi:hypothetical protein
MQKGGGEDAMQIAECKYQRSKWRMVVADNSDTRNQYADTLTESRDGGSASVSAPIANNELGREAGLAGRLGVGLQFPGAGSGVRGTGLQG